MREPDFILYSPDCGLIVMEVKDWAITQILEADPKNVLLQLGNREERRKNPVQQAREYMKSLLSLLNKPVFGIQGKIPRVSICIVLPHISRKELREHVLEPVFSGAVLLCWDDLQENSVFLRDVSGQQFRQWLKTHFGSNDSGSLTHTDLNRIRAAIFPHVRLELPRKKILDQEKSDRLLAFDRDQENLARTFGSGRHLILGPAGSGRTLILVHQAWHLPRVNRNCRRILFVCFNLSLVGYIKRLLAQKGVRLGKDGVEVYPFYSLCERIIGENVPHASESDFYSLVVQESLEQLNGEHPLQNFWDAVLVDEGQDFSCDMANVLLRLLSPKTMLTVVQDESQQIYQKNAVGWQDMGIPNLQVHHVHRQYRNSREIAHFAARILKKIPDEETLLGEEGDKPSWIVSSDLSSQVQDVAKAVADMVHAGHPMNEIAILYTKGQMEGRASLPKALLHALEAHGIMARWSAQDTASKLSYDITTDSVTISTVYSAKGLDFATVFLLGLDRINPAQVKDRSLAYVGITRARERLFLAVCATVDDMQRTWGL